MKVTVLILTILLSNTVLCGQKIKDLDVNFMLRGQIYAGSSIEDKNALGGFASSNHTPKKIRLRDDFEKNGFYIKIDTSKIIVLAEKYNGYKLYIINKSKDIVELNASDSRLYMIAEAFIDGKWKPIEYLPSSFCGNSYHRVLINSNEYWDFDVPRFSGKIKTKIRYRLGLENNKYIYSNEISASINKKQLTQKQGYNSKGLMDPYID